MSLQGNYVLLMLTVALNSQARTVGALFEAIFGTVIMLYLSLEKNEGLVMQKRAILLLACRKVGTLARTNRIASSEDVNVCTDKQLKNPSLTGYDLLTRRNDIS